MKILIVGKGDIRSALKLSLTGNEVIESDHDNALLDFLKEEPQSVIILEFEKNGPGEITYKDIKNSCLKEIVIRSGFSSMEADDYLQMPFRLESLYKLLNI